MLNNLIIHFSTKKTVERARTGVAMHPAPHPRTISMTPFLEGKWNIIENQLQPPTGSILETNGHRVFRCFPCSILWSALEEISMDFCQVSLQIMLGLVIQSNHKRPKTSQSINILPYRGLLFVDHFPLERNPWDSIYVNQRVAKPLPARGCNQAAHWRPLPPTHPSCFAGLSSFPVSRMVFRRTSHLRGKHRRLDALSLEDHAHYHTFRKSEPEFLMHTAKKNGTAQFWESPTSPHPPQTFCRAASQLTLRLQLTPLGVSGPTGLPASEHARLLWHLDDNLTLETKNDEEYVATLSNPANESWELDWNNI